MYLQPPGPGIVDFLHAVWVTDELQVRSHSQPVGHVNAVVEFGVVLGFLYRQVCRVIVILDTIGHIGQCCILAVRRVHMHFGHCQPDIIPFAGGYGLQTPFGVIYSTNITPDPQTGIGRWTERDFFRAVRHGQRKDGQRLYPAMPYNAYVKISDADLHDLWAYMRTVQPVQQAPTPKTLSFPYNIRQTLLGWNLLFFDNTPFVPQPEQSAQWNRGRYLVDGAGHCAACHTPKNLLGGDTGHYLQGAELLTATRRRSPATVIAGWAAGARSR